VQVPRRKPEERPAEAEIDLHGLPPEKALRKLERALHAARVRGQKSILVITGRGLGNTTQTPVLRPKVEAFLRTPAGKRLGVVSFELASRGGALFVSLRVNGTAREIDAEDEWTD
jgi:DNA-nicking Smr family endonuclease